jgi:uncharacterized protein (TIGR03437 family)
VVDPVVEFSTYVGGGNVEENFSLVVDDSGNLVIAGQSSSPDFPTDRNAWDRRHNGPPVADDGSDVVVFRLSPDGKRLLQSTFIGGSGRERTRCHGTALALDTDGRMIVSGSTSSNDFPTTPGAYDSSYNGGDDDGEGDAVLFVLSPDGSELAYSTYLGGAKAEENVCVVLAEDGVPVLAGQTRSPRFPTTLNSFDPISNGGSEIFLSKLSTLGNGAADLVYSTFLGGSDREGDPSHIRLPDGRIALACETGSDDFPTTAGAPQRTYHGEGDIAITALDLKRPGPGALSYSTLLGGSGADYIDGYGRNIDTDAAGDLYVVFETTTTHASAVPLVVTPGAFQSQHGSGAMPVAGEFDNFLVKIRPAGAGAQDIVYATYLGGRGNDDDPGIVVSPAGYAFVASQTESIRFPTLNPIQAAMRGGADAAVSAFAPDGGLVFSTYLGGSDRERDQSLVLIGAGAPPMTVAGAREPRLAAAEPALYVIGETESFDYPTTAGTYARASAGSVDMVLTKIVGLNFLAQPTPAATTVSAASFAAPVSPDSIVTIYVAGADWPLSFPASSTAPTALGGVSVQIIDALDAEWASPLFFVGANQINCAFDADVAEGEATVNVLLNGELAGTGAVKVQRVAPGIFFHGDRIAAAFSLTVHPDNSRTQIETFNSALEPREIDLGPEGTGVYLLLFGTGFRNHSGDVSVTVGGEPVPVLGAVAHISFAGLDQTNAGPLPRSLVGRGLVDVVMTIDGIVANVVKVLIR